MTLFLPVAVDQTLAEIALGHASASEVLHRHRLDFCCRGEMTLAEACSRSDVDAESVAAELKEECSQPSLAMDWEKSPLRALLEHVQQRYHRDQRLELPRLLAMAHRVERIHAESKAAPHGLHTHLESLLQSLNAHMKKEEQMLFPMLRAGLGTRAYMPVQILRNENREHSDALTHTRELCTDFCAPDEACDTWKALYAGLDEFEKALMDHITIENHVLFRRALFG